MPSSRRSRPRPTSRALVVLGLVASLLLTAGPAGAAPPFRESQAGLGISCDLDDGFLSVFASEFEDGTEVLDVFVETADGFAFGFSEEATVDDTTASGSVELVDEDTGEVVGAATVDVTLTPSGPTESFRDRFRSGNVLERTSEEFTPATATGTLELSGFVDETVDLAQDCSGSLFSFTFFATNPATFVDRIDEQFLDCGVDGPNGSGFLSAFATDDVADVSLFLQTPEGAVFGFAEDPTFTQEVLSATLELVDDETGEPAGTADVAATLTPSGSFSDRVQTPRETIKVDVEEFAVEGTLTIGEDVYDLTDCFAQSVEGRVRFTSTPPRGGPPAPNDAPGGAIAVPVPWSVRTTTFGAEDEPEAPCVVVFDDGEDVFEDPLPITNTVWYSFEGTGGPVTIDTAASDFDTIVGVYDTGLTQVACVDDVDDSLQARVTVETVAGETYLVQVGGFAGSVGRLELTIG